LSRDGADPAELRRIARGELGACPSAKVLDTAVESAAPAGERFEVTFAGTPAARARRLRLATGLTGALPEVDGLARLWGRGTTAPTAHGWENRDLPVAVLGGGDQAAHVALNLARLGCDVVLCTSGPLLAGAAARRALQARRHSGMRGSPAGRRRRAGQVRAAEPVPGLDAGTPRALPAPGAAAGIRPCARARLRATARRRGAGERAGQTSVPGVYAAGDLCRTPAMPAPAAQVVMAAAQGARAAVVIDQEILLSDAYSGPGEQASMASRRHPRLGVP